MQPSSRERGYRIGSGSGRAGRGLAAAVLATVLLLCAGCQESVERRVEKANIALRARAYPEALRLSLSVLDQEPSNFEARKVKIRCQLVMGYLRNARNELDQTLAAHPGDADLRQLETIWMDESYGELLRYSDLNVKPELVERFDALNETAGKLAQWYEQQPKGAATAAFILARRERYAARRIERALARHEIMLLDSSLSLDKKQALDAARQQAGADRDTHELAMLEHLRRVHQLSPQLYAATAMYIEALADRRLHREVWEAAQLHLKLAGQDLTAELVRNFCNALLAIPERLQPRSDTVEAARQLMDSAAPDQRSTREWQLANILVLEAQGQVAKAQQAIERLQVDAKSDREPDLRIPFALARLHFNQQKYKDAADVLKPVYEKTRSSDVHTLYGLSLSKLGDRAGARAVLRANLDRNPNDPTARESLLAVMAEEGFLAEAERDVDDYLRRRGQDIRAIRIAMQFELARGRRDQFVALLSRVADAHPLTEEHLLVLIEGHLRLDQADKARQYAEQLLKLQPDRIENHLLLAEAELAAGRKDVARSILEPLPQRFKTGESAAELLGSLLIRRESFEQAVEVLSPLVLAQPQAHRLRLMLAHALAAANRHSEAIEQVNAVLAQDQKNSAAHALATRLYQAMGQFADANDHLAQLDPTALDERAAPALLAQLHQRDGRIEEALNVCHRALVLGNTDPVLRIVLANLYKAKNDPERQELHLLALLRHEPRNPQVYDLLAEYYLERKAVQRGVDALDNLDADPVLAGMTQARLLLTVNQHESAIYKLEQPLKKLLAAKDDRAMMLADRIAQIQMMLKTPRLAARPYADMIAAGVRAPEARLKLLGIQGSGSELQKVIEQLVSQAGSVGADQPRLRGELVSQLLSLRAVDQTLQVIDGWIAQSPGDLALLVLKGQVYYGLSRPAEAAAVYRKALELSPKDVLLRLRLAGALVADYDYPAAEAVCQAGIEVEPASRPAMLGYIGMLQLNLGLHRQAVRTFKLLDQAESTRDPQVMLAWARALMLSGDLASAATTFERITALSAHYVPAQIWLARLEHRQNQTAKAGRRIAALLQDTRHASPAAQMLLAGDLRDPETQAIFAAADSTTATDKLAESVQVNWLATRAALAANARNWPAVLAEVEQLAKLQPKLIPLHAMRLLLLMQADRGEEAAVLLRSTPGLPESPAGALVARVLGPSIMNTGLREIPPVPEAAVFVYVDAGMRADLAAMRRAVSLLPSHPWLLASDLLAAIPANSNVVPRDFMDQHKRLALAVAALSSGLPQLAEDHIREALTINPNHVPSIALLLWSLQDQGKPLEPGLAMLKAVDSPSSLALLTRAQELAGTQPAEALKVLQNLAQAEPTHSLVRLRLAQLLQTTQRASEALPIYQSLLQNSDIRKDIVLREYALVLGTQGPKPLEEAASLLADAYRKAPRDMELLQTLGWLEHLRGQDAVALKYLSVANLALPESTVLHQRLTTVYQSLGNEAWAGYHRDGR